MQTCLDKGTMFVTCSSFLLKFLQETSRLPCNSDKLNCFQCLSPGSLCKFGTILICFSGETNTGSEIVFSKQEPKGHIIYEFPLWVKCFHCLLLIWAAVTRWRFPSNIFLSNASLCFGAKEEEAGCGQKPRAQPRLPTLLFTPKWQQQSSDKLQVKIAPPAIDRPFSLSAPRQEWRDQKHRELSSLKQQGEGDHNHHILKTGHRLWEGIYLAHHLTWQHGLTMSSSFPGESFITATLQDFGLNILYKCHKAEEHIKTKIPQNKPKFYGKKKKSIMISCFSQEWLFHSQEPWSICFYFLFLFVWYTHRKGLQLLWHVKFNLKGIQVKM